MTRYYLILLTLAALSFSCKSEKDKEEGKARENEQVLAYTNDGEQVLGWVNQQTLKEDSAAHSGRFVSVLDSVNPYSLTLREKVSKIKEAGATKVFVRAWVKLSSLPGTGCLTVSVDNNGKNYLWQCLPVESAAKEAGTWTELTCKVSLADITDNDALLSVYIWNKSKAPILIDDMEVIFEK